MPLNGGFEQHKPEISVFFHILIVSCCFLPLFSTFLRHNTLSDFSLKPCTCF